MEIGLSVGLPTFLMLAGYALVIWAQGNTKHPKPKKTVGYQIAYNGANFVWFAHKDDYYYGVLHFDKKPQKNTLEYTPGICDLNQRGYKYSITISKACDIEQVLQKFIEANW